MTPSDTVAERGGGNVFVDLGVSDTDAHLVKADLASRIDDLVRDSGLTQTEIVRRMGLSRSAVSRLLWGDFREYSLERLLNALGRDIDIPPPAADGCASPPSPFDAPTPAGEDVSGSGASACG